MTALDYSTESHKFPDGKTGLKLYHIGHNDYGSADNPAIHLSEIEHILMHPDGICMIKKFGRRESQAIPMLPHKKEAISLDEIKVDVVEEDVQLAGDDDHRNIDRKRHIEFSAPKTKEHSEIGAHRIPFCALN